jgi:LPXTG-motif cell wall-anchored protein
MWRDSGRRTRARVTLIAGAILIAVAFASLPPGAPPLYDSLRIPDEPYRHLSTSAASQETRPPTTARQEVAVNDPVINITTAEKRPQAYLLVQTGALQPVGGTTRIVASLTPVPLPVPAPGDGVPLGNAYDVQVRDQDGNPLEPSGKGQLPVVQLRIPNPSTPPRIAVELRQHGVWTSLRTIHTADVIYAAELPSFGTVVAVYTGATSPPVPATGKRGFPWSVLIGGLLAIIALTGLVALRRRRRRTNAPDV